jgi:hypothetical protein
LRAKSRAVNAERNAVSFKRIGARHESFNLTLPISQGPGFWHTVAFKINTATLGKAQAQGRETAERRLRARPLSCYQVNFQQLMKTRSSPDT